MIAALVNYLIENKIRLFILLSIWLGLHFFFLGPYSYIPIFDNADVFIPRLLALKIRNADDYWFPYMAGGVDRLSQQGMSYQYLYQLLSTFLPVWIVYQLHIFFHFFLSSYFMYKLCKRYISLSENSSIFAGCFYAFYRHDFLIVSIGYDLLPFVLLSLEAILEKSKTNKLSWLWLIPLALLNSSLSDPTCTTPFVFVIIPVYFCLMRNKGGRNFWTYFLIFSFFSFAYYVRTIWAMRLNISSSHRITADYIIPAITKMDKQFYLEVLNRIYWTLGKPLLLVMTLLGIILSRFRNRIFNTSLVALLFTSFGAALIVLIKAKLMPYLSFFRGVNFDYIHAVSPFFFGITAAYLFEFISKNAVINSHNNVRAWNVYKIALVVFSLWFLCDTLKTKKDDLMVWIRSGNYVSSFESEKMGTLAEKIDYKNLFRVATVRMSLLPGYANGYGLESADGYLQIYSERYFRFWSKILEPLSMRNDHYNRYFNNWGNRIYLFPPEETAAQLIVEDNYRMNLLSLANTKYIISRTKLVDKSLVPIFEAEKPFYSLPKKEMALIRLKENFFGNYYFNIYENKDVLPRVFIAKNIKVFKNYNQLLSKMSDTSAKELRDAVFIEEGDISNLDLSNLGFNKANISIDSYLPDLIRISVDTDGFGIMVVTNTYNKFWKVKVDGKGGTIIPVYHTFWGVPLGKGTHQVEFYYDPPYKFAL